MLKVKYSDLVGIANFGAWFASYKPPALSYDNLSSELFCAHRGLWRVELQSGKIDYQALWSAEMDANLIGHTEKYLILSLKSVHDEVVNHVFLYDRVTLSIVAETKINFRSISGFCFHPLKPVIWLSTSMQKESLENKDELYTALYEWDYERSKIIMLDKMDNDEGFAIHPPFLIGNELFWLNQRSLLKNLNLSSRVLQEHGKIFEHTIWCSQYVEKEKNLYLGITDVNGYGCDPGVEIWSFDVFPPILTKRIGSGEWGQSRPHAQAVLKEKYVVTCFEWELPYDSRLSTNYEQGFHLRVWDTVQYTAGRDQTFPIHLKYPPLDGDASYLIKPFGISALVPVLNDNIVVSAHPLAEATILRLWDWQAQKHILTMVLFRDGEWVAYTPEHAFDCSLNARQYLLWQDDANDQPVPNEIWQCYYQPGLVQNVAGQFS